MMETSRRDLIAAGSMLTALMAAGAGSAAGAAPDPAPPGLAEVFHVHVGMDGKSQAKRVKIHGSMKPIPVKEMLFGAIGAGDGRWGNVPSKRFSVNVVGDLQVTLGDGTQHRLGKGDLVYLEDLTGTGHFTQFLTPVANLYIMVADDFDLEEWASSPPAAA